MSQSISHLLALLLTLVSVLSSKVSRCNVVILTREVSLASGNSMIDDSRMMTFNVLDHFTLVVDEPRDHSIIYQHLEQTNDNFRLVKSIFYFGGNCKFCDLPLLTSRPISSCNLSLHSTYIYLDFADALIPITIFYSNIKSTTFAPTLKTRH